MRDTTWVTAGRPPGVARLTKVAATAVGPGRLLVVAVDDRHRLWTNGHGAGSWTGWAPLDGSTAARPSLAGPYLTVRGADGRLLFRRRDRSGWRPWAPVPGLTGSVATLSRYAGRVVAFHAVHAGTLWSRVFDGARFRAGWAPVPGHPRDLIRHAGAGGGRIVVQDSAYTVWVGRRDGARWRWDDAGRPPAPGPAWDPVTCGTGWYAVWGGDGRIWGTTGDRRWRPVGERDFASQPAVAATGPARRAVLAVGTDGALWLAQLG